MADFNALTPPDTETIKMEPRVPGQKVKDIPDVTTYFYRTAAGTRSSTTIFNTIPQGAIIERIRTVAGQ